MKSAQRNARIRYLASRAVNIASLAFFVFSIVNMVHFLSGTSSSWLVGTMNAILPLHMTRTIEEPNATLPGVLLYYVYGVAGILVSSAQYFSGEGRSRASSRSGGHSSS